MADRFYSVMQTPRIAERILASMMRKKRCILQLCLVSESMYLIVTPLAYRGIRLKKLSHFDTSQDRLEAMIEARYTPSSTNSTTPRKIPRDHYLRVQHALAHTRKLEFHLDPPLFEDRDWPSESSRKSSSDDSQSMGDDEDERVSTEYDHSPAFSPASLSDREAGMSLDERERPGAISEEDLHQWSPGPIADGSYYGSNGAFHTDFEYEENPPRESSYLFDILAIARQNAQARPSVPSRSLRGSSAGSNADVGDLNSDVHMPAPRTDRDAQSLGSRARAADDHSLGGSVDDREEDGKVLS